MIEHICYKNSISRICMCCIASPPVCCAAFHTSSYAMQLDDVMGTATAVAGRVGEQSRIFENIGNKVLAVGAKFPAINGIINAVRRKKSKVHLAMIQLHSLCQCLISGWKPPAYLDFALQDTIILASVISVCTVFILIYWISKH